MLDKYTVTTAKLQYQAVINYPVIDYPIEIVYEHGIQLVALTIAPHGWLYLNVEGALGNVKG